MNFSRILFSLLLLIPLNVIAESAWVGSLHDGSQITINPTTNKATRSWQGEQTQLWDGVHQLDNGAVVIVRDGVVIKDMAILQAQKEHQVGQLQAACMNLVRKVCGPRNECETHPACDPARQLLMMEDEERHSAWRGVTTESSKQCLRVLNDESFFKLCTQSSAGKPLSPCEKLQGRVCGSKNQCADSEACNLASQLIKMEREDLLASPRGNSYASNQCSDSANNNKFFRTCQE